MNSSPLQQHVEDYLTLRATLGYKLANHRTLLSDFVGFVEQRGGLSHITAAIALDWATSSPKAGPAGQTWRLQLVRGFINYLQAFIPSVQAPSNRLLRTVRRKKPYLFSDDEVGRMIKVALALSPRASIRPATYATLIALLVSTGLRICEALNLKVEDVKLSDANAHIIVRQMKFGKSRLVPFHPTTTEGLREYSRRRNQCNCGSQFFAAARCGVLRYRTVCDTFHTIWRRAGIIQTADGRRPTIHSLRHTFAVNRLLAWQKEGVDIKVMLPHLSIYLGHTEPKNTYWYLSATPELLALTMDKFAAYAARGDAP